MAFSHFAVAASAHATNDFGVGTQSESVPHMECRHRAMAYPLELNVAQMNELCQNAQSTFVVECAEFGYWHKSVGKDEAVKTCKTGPNQEINKDCFYDTMQFGMQLETMVHLCLRYSP